MLASGVKAVTFDITEDANNSGVVVAREIDIFGVPSLTDLDWEPLVTIPAAASEWIEILDPIPTGPTRYYRIIWNR